MIQSLASPALDRARAPAEPGEPRGAWHPRTLWTCGHALLSTARILPRLGRAEHPTRLLSGWSRNLLSVLHVEVEIAAPIPQEPQLWVANHLSWLDPLVLMAQRPMGTLAKADVAGYPVLGRHARRAGLLFVAREDPTQRAAVLFELIREWRKGSPFLLFPEGTTTNGTSLAPFYEGGLRTAFRLGLKVLPLRVESPDAHYPWTGDASLPPHFQALCRACRTRVRVYPGPVMTPTGDEEIWLRTLRAYLEPRSI